MDTAVMRTSELSQDDSVSRAQPSVNFIYESLNHTLEEIRILEILPVDGDDHSSPLRCRLRRCTLDERPTYTAISYAWGDPTITDTVLVNDEEVKVTVNLADALRQLRRDGVKEVWADAICINQRNDLEKNHQVQMMKRIYESAELVIAWLRMEENGSAEALETLRRLAELAGGQNIRTVFNLHPEHMSEERTNLLGSTIDQLMNDSSLIGPEVVESISALMSRSYWKRVWVIQEVCVAKSVILQCDSTSLPWSKLCMSAALSYFWRLYLINERRMHRWCYELLFLLGRPVVGIYHAYKHPNRSLDLWDILHDITIGVDLRTTESKDRIYALLGLLEEEQRAGMIVDYRATDTMVFQQTTENLLTQYGCEVLAFAGLANQELCGKVSLPSWAVDWNFSSNKLEHSITHLNGGIGWCSSPPTPVCGVLPLRGVLVGQVTDVFCYEGGRNGFQDLWRTINNLHPDVFSQAVFDITSDDLFGQGSNDPWPVILNVKRNVFVTEQGYLGNAPLAVEIGDMLCFFEDCDIPFSIRKRAQGGWVLVSGAFVEGMIEGEIWEEDLPFEEILLH